MKHASFIVTLLALFAAHATAQIKLPSFFSDGMVLQQQTQVRLWGWCEKMDGGTPGKEVTVSTSWDGKTYTTRSDRNGRFEVTVQTPQAGGPYDITFSDGRQLHLSNILIGEVWLCSGQSNMEMNMKGYKGQPVEGATEALLSCNDPQLRLFTVKHSTQATPQSDVAGGTWAAATPGSVRQASATAYFFGRALRQSLDVPVGLIVTAYGGSACEAWMKPEWLEAFPQVKTLLTADVQRAKQRSPSALWNGQLVPLVGYGIKGAIWYQGEDNVPRAYYYAPLLKAMVEGWRKEWGQGDFPFYYCQIAPYDYSLIEWSGSELLREQQMKAEKMISNARMAVLMDAGLKYGIHPRKKRQAGERLALLALSNTYSVKGLPDFAVYSSVEFKGDTAVVAFDRSKEWVYFEHGTTSPNFEVCGADSVFHPAEAWTSRNRVYVRSSEVSHPVAVRYAFHDWAEGDLMHDGLPVSSFRSDQ